jgi:Tfp pilus assembly protein PilO
MDESRKNPLLIPKSSIKFLLICLGGVVLFIVIGLLPMNYAVSSLDKKEADLKLKLEEQEQLGPIYQTLQKQMTERKVPTSLPMPARTKLSKDQVDQASVTIRGLAKAAQLEVMSVNPELGTVGGDAKVAPVAVTVRGGMTQFRNFFTALGGLSYLERFDAIEVRPVQSALELKMKLLVALN